MVDYRGKLVLAPMVRIGELPTRLLALRHGCDLVWGPEIIDKKLLQCERVVNTKLNTVDFLATKSPTKIPGVTNLVFRTSPTLEKGKLIFQMGTASPELAVNAAKIVIDDVSGIDINAGCPKHFSVHSGMGAALLSTPDLLCDILTRLVKEVGLPKGKPISVKIRLLPTREETMALVDKLLGTGISNLTLHCRTKTMRNREPPIRDHILEIFDKCKLANVSFIVNGSLKDRHDLIKLQAQYGPELGGMIASLAEINPTCFSKEGALKWPQMIKEFIQICGDFSNWKGNTKYCITRMVPAGDNRDTKKIYQEIARAKDQEDLEKIVFEKVGDNGEYIELKKVELTGELKLGVDTALKRELEENDVSTAKKLKISV